MPWKHLAIHTDIAGVARNAPLFDSMDLHLAMQSAPLAPPYNEGEPARKRKDSYGGVVALPAPSSSVL
eukprot:6459909-Amphidinium_carterae.1